MVFTEWRAHRRGAPDLRELAHTWALSVVAGLAANEAAVPVPRTRKNGREQRRQAREVADNLQQESLKGRQGTTFTDQYRRYQRRRFLAFALVALGAVVVVTHVVVHLGNITWLPTTGLQDLVTGYPMGGLLIVLGLFVLSRE